MTMARSGDGGHAAGADSLALAGARHALHADAVPHETLGADSTDAGVNDVMFDLGGDERRMHVRAYNHWVSLLDGRPYPSIANLEPETITDFGPHSVLLDFSHGMGDPKIAYLGRALREECGLEGPIATIADVPSRCPRDAAAFGRDRAGLGRWSEQRFRKRRAAGAGAGARLPPALPNAAVGRAADRAARRAAGDGPRKRGAPACRRSAQSRRARSGIESGA
jgi:hypothetical protein